MKRILGRKKGWELLSWVGVVLQTPGGIWLYQNIARVMRFSCFSIYLTSTYLLTLLFKAKQQQQKLKCLLCFVKFLKHKSYKNYSIFLVFISFQEKNI